MTDEARIEAITVSCSHGYALRIDPRDFCERHAPKAPADKPLTRKEKRAWKRLNKGL